MHDRNIFKNEKPDFEKLAVEYEQFAPYVKKGLSGKSYVNFKDPASLRALSCVLLQKYFNISIEVPLDRLIPTIPLRLNYIHWIEDLLGNKKNEDVFGIDIGCGASCVYSLLGNRLNKWRFVVTEIDEESKNCAVENVNRNKMEDDVKVVKVTKDDPPLSGLLRNSEQEIFDFCMCNPPFFDEVNEVHSNRTDHRPPPDSISTANENESFTKGGEVEFIKKMINDSLNLKGKIKWYTSMVGKKSSIKHVTRYLQENGIKDHATTIFKQGKTMRWAIAWSFTESAIKKKSDESGKKAKPFFLAPSDAFYHSNSIPILTSNQALGGISEILSKLTNFICKEFDDLAIITDGPVPVLLQNRTAYEITGKAYNNKWTHQRRKRREEKFSKQKVMTGSSVNGESLHSSDITDSKGTNDVLIKNTNKRKHRDTEEGVQSKRVCCTSSSEVSTDINKKKSSRDTNDSVQTTDPLFEFSCTIGQTSQFSLDNSDSIILSFLCLSGNRDIFYQLVMYFKNTLGATQVNLKQWQ